MSNESFGSSILIIFLAVLLSFIIAVLVMLLWNWLMPVIFGLVKITYWQAWGLTILCNCLFKSIHSKDE